MVMVKVKVEEEHAAARTQGSAQFSRQPAAPDRREAKAGVKRRWQQELVKATLHVSLPYVEPVRRRSLCLRRGPCTAVADARGVYGGSARSVLESLVSNKRRRAPPFLVTRNKAAYLQGSAADKHATIP